MLQNCQNPNYCRKIATQTLQLGTWNWDNLEDIGDMEKAYPEVKEEIELCAYCAEDMAQNYRENKPGFAFARTI